MLDRKIKEELERELEVPESIRKRVKYTLDDIRLSEFGNNEKHTNLQKREKQKKFYGKSVAAAACLLLASSITVTAAVVKWTPDFVKRFQISEDLQKSLKDAGVADTPLQTVEHNGISIALEQCLTDNEFFTCLFKVMVPEKMNGYFDLIEVEGYKEEDIIMSTSCSWQESTAEVNGTEYDIYYYVISGEHKRISNADFGEEEAGNSTSDINVVKGSCVTEEDYKTGHMTFRFENFVDESANEQILASGPWEFQWAEKQVDARKEYAMNQKVNNGYYAKSNAVLKQVSVSPIVVSTVFEIPDRPEDKMNLSIYPAQATAVELKDGTIVTLEQGMVAAGFEDYQDDENNNFKYTFFLNTVLDPEEVAAIYFGTNERIQLQ